MSKSIKTRIEDLEKHSDKPDKKPPYISLKPGEPIPEGMEGVKVYIGFGPDDWDNDELCTSKKLERESAKE